MHYQKAKVMQHSVSFDLRFPRRVSNTTFITETDFYAAPGILWVSAIDGLFSLFTLNSNSNDTVSALNELLSRPQSQTCQLAMEHQGMCVAGGSGGCVISGHTGFWREVTHISDKSALG